MKVHKWQMKNNPFCSFKNIPTNLLLGIWYISILSQMYLITQSIHYEQISQQHSCIMFGNSKKIKNIFWPEVLGFRAAPEWGSVSSLWRIAGARSGCSRKCRRNPIRIQDPECQVDPEVLRDLGRSILVDPKCKN